MPMRLATSSLLAVLIALSFVWLEASAQEQDKLTLLAAKSKITFIGTKPDGKHEGGFKEFTGHVSPGKSPAEASLLLEIATESIFADDPKLTAHLKTPDFFNVRSHPKAVFKSTRIEEKSAAEGEKGGVIHGTLTLLGKSKELSVPVKVEASGEAVVLKAEFEIDRTDFGMDYGAGKIDNKVKIAAELHFPKK
jgi:polyisoprenoid-binding protein YceI